MLPTTFRFIWPGGFGVEVFRESTNQQHELPVLTMFVNGSKMSNRYRGPSIDATYHVSVQLAKRFQSRFFFQKSTNQQHELPVLAMFANESKFSNLYRGPSIDATYYDSVHLAKRFQRRFFRNRPISNTNCLCWPCFLTDPKLAIFIASTESSTATWACALNTQSSL